MTDYGGSMRWAERVVRLLLACYCDKMTCLGDKSTELSSTCGRNSTKLATRSLRFGNLHRIAIAATVLAATSADLSTPGSCLCHKVLAAGHLECTIGCVLLHHADTPGKMVTVWDPVTPGTVPWAMVAANKIRGSTVLASLATATE